MNTKDSKTISYSPASTGVQQTKHLHKQTNLSSKDSAESKRVKESVNMGILHFSNFPAEAIPKVGSQPYVLWHLLVDGTRHYRKVLIQHKQLGETLRSPLQALRSDKYHNWNIISGNDEVTGESFLQLDPRHLSGDAEQDAAARRERRKQLKEVSAKEATQGRIREPRALRERGVAQAEYFKSLGDAANDEN